MYKQFQGRMNMPKTGRGINAATLMTGSPAQMSPLNEIQFPVTPGMKFEAYEQVLDKRSGKLVDSSVVTNAKKGEDLSQYEGVTNISQVRSAKGNEGASDGMGTEAIVNRRTNLGSTNNPNKKSRVRSKSSVFIPVNTNTDQGVDYDKDGNIVSTTDFSMYKNPTLKQKLNKQRKPNNTARTMGQLQGISTAYLDSQGQFDDRLASDSNSNYGLSKDLTDQTRTNDNQDLYTTARITSKQDQTNFGNTIKYDKENQLGQKQDRKNETSNLTQKNKNFKDVFTLNDIQGDVAKNKNQYFYEGRPNANKSFANSGKQGRGILASGKLAKNKQDDYEHLDLFGSLQGNVKFNNKQDRNNYFAEKAFGKGQATGRVQDTSTLNKKRR